MLTGPSAQEPEHPLAYLPFAKILELSKGDVIYGAPTFSTALYLIIEGIVKVQRIIGKRVITVVDIYCTDELFGESTFTGLSDTHEIATAMVKTHVMMWGRNVIEELIPLQPHIAVALIQLLTKRSIVLARRIESFVTDNSERRLARTLIYFSERFGHTTEGRLIKMIPLSHGLLAQYIGTTRENVTLFMIRFRSKGYVQYSRKEILLYPDALRKWLNEEPNLASAGGATSL